MERDPEFERLMGQLGPIDTTLSTSEAAQSVPVPAGSGGGGILFGSPEYREKLEGFADMLGQVLGGAVPPVPPADTEPKSKPEGPDLGGFKLPFWP